jgi:hypothetical protein
MLGYVIVVLVVSLIGLPIWMDHQARRRKQKIRSSSEMLAERRSRRGGLRSTPQHGVPMTGLNDWSRQQKIERNGF